MSALATEDMSAVETGPMSAAETGQMSAVETRQMSTIATGLRPVLILDICLVSIADTSVLSQHTMLMSQKSQLSQCHSVQVADRRSGPRWAKMLRNGSRMVARS